ncbi:MAG: DMT family transporter [Bernardetiaceae bacterium]
MKTIASRLSSNAWAWVGLVLLALIWGSSFILIKRGVAVYAPAVVGSARIGIAALVLLPFAWPHRHKAHRKDWLHLAVVGFFGNLLPAYLFSKAETVLSSSVTGVLNALTPLSVLLVGVWFFGQVFRWEKLVGLLLAFAGAVGLALLGDATEKTTGAAPSYALLVLMATVCYGISANTIKFRLSHFRPIEIAGLSFMTMFPLAASYLLFSDVATTWGSHPDAAVAMGYIAFLALVGTAFALVVFNTIIRLKSPVFAASVTYLIPIVALFWGIVDGERLNLVQLISAAVILLGVYGASRVR